MFASRKGWKRAAQTQQHRCSSSCTDADQAPPSQELLPQAGNCSGSCTGWLIPTTSPCCLTRLRMQVLLFPACPAPSRPSLYARHTSGAAVQIDLSPKVIHPSGNRLTAWALRGITGKESVQTGRKHLYQLALGVKLLAIPPGMGIRVTHGPGMARKSRAAAELETSWDPVQ